MSAPPVQAEAKPRSTSQVYGCLGCSAQCGRCARTIRRIMDEALDAQPADGLQRLPAPAILNRRNCRENRHGPPQAYSRNVL